MTFNLDQFKPLIPAFEAAGLPVLQGIVTAALGPAGFIVAPVLDFLLPAVNHALGIDPATPPDQTAAKIMDDPAEAQSRLAAVQEDHSFVLQKTKQTQDYQVTSQAQQTALSAVEIQNPSLFIGGWRAAAAWVCVVALAIDTVLLPQVAWVASVYGHVLPPPPDVTALLGLLGGLLGLGLLRTVDKAQGTASPKIGGTSTVLAKRVLR